MQFAQTDAAGDVGLMARLRRRWPQQNLDYIKSLATTVLLLVLLPLALLAFIRHPLAVGDAAVRNHGLAY